MSEFFKFEKTKFEGLYVIHNFNEEESCFYEKNTFFSNGLDMIFVQDNESFSIQNVLRGMHIQIKKPQGKLVYVLEGTIQDVVVDLRRDSETFGEWYSIVLSKNNKKSLYIPEGFAHGFLTLSTEAHVQFKVSNYWDPVDEIGIPWNDDFLKIKWLLGNKTKPILSKKDSNYTSLLSKEMFRERIISMQGDNN